MFAKLIAARGDAVEDQGRRWRPEGHPVRVGVFTSPVVVLGATVAAAACLMGDCCKGSKTHSRETRIGHAGAVHSIAYRADGAVLSSVGADGSIVLWGLTKRTDHAFPPEGPGQVRSAAFSPDNRVVATANLTGAVALHDLVDRETHGLLDPAASTTGASCLAFASDGATLAVGQQDGQITLWDSSNGFRRSTLAGHAEFVASLAFAQDGTTLVSSGGDHSVRVWDLPAGRERFLIQNPTRTFAALSISPDGRLLALGDQVNPVVRIWDLTTETEHEALRGASGAVVAVAISPDGAILAAADFKGSVTFWDLATLKLCPKRLKHSGVHSLAFAPDGRTLATGGFDGIIHIWNFPIE